MSRARSLRLLAALFALLFSACAARAEAWPTLESTTRSRYEELAGQLKAFPTGEFAHGRGERPLFYDLLPREWAELWRTVHAAISTGKEDTADLVGLGGVTAFRGSTPRPEVF